MQKQEVMVMDVCRRQQDLSRLSAGVGMIEPRLPTGAGEMVRNGYKSRTDWTSVSAEAGTHWAGVSAGAGGIRQ